MEIWKDIIGYENKYQISNLGNVKSLSLKSNNKVILKTYLSENGYVKIRLNKNGKSKNYRVHRLVLNSFKDNPKNLSDVNHINGIKTDNRLENLEWISRKENIIHSFKLGLSVRSKNAGRQSAKVIDTKTSIIYDSVCELARLLNINHSTLRYRIKCSKTIYKMV